MPLRGPSPEQPRQFRSGPIGAIDFALFGPAGPASDTLNNKKDPSKYKESKKNGAKRTRTADPLHAMQVLYQLSYGPMIGLGSGNIWWSSA